MIQFILGIILVLIGIFVFWKFPLKHDLKTLTLAALLVVVIVVLKRLAVMVPLFGAETFKITFEAIPLMLAGLMLSPSYAYLIALATDLLGLLVFPTGFPFLGFTLNAVITALIPGLVSLKVDLKAKTLEKLIMGLVLGMGFISLIYFYFIKTINLTGKPEPFRLEMKVSLIVIALLMVGILFFLMYHYNQRLDKDELHLFYQWCGSVILVYICVNFFLTPYWLLVMYKVPFMLSMAARVIKAVIMIPLDIIIGFSVYRIIKRLI